MTDSAATVRLLLPDGKPARGIFPGLAADLDTPVFAACSFVPSSPADNARQNVACPLAPTADARARFQQCQTSKCSLLQVELDHEASKVEHVDSDSAWLYDSRDAIAAATRLHDRTLAHCTTEYWAAYGSLCISLDAPVLRNMTLPQLPSDVPSSLRQLHQDHLASRRAPGGNATVNPTTTADSLKLGICAPFPPFGIPCDPAQVNSDGSFRGSIGIPQIEPMPRSVILSRALPQGSTWPRVVEGVESLPPVRHFQAMPSELRASSSRASLSSNLMALTTCSENKLLVPAKRAGDKCQETSECQFGGCQGSTGSWGTSTRTCVPTVTAIRNLAVNFNSGGSAPPMATTWLPPPGRGSSSNDSDSLFVPIFALATAFGIGFLVLLLVGRSGRGTKAQPLQTEPRPLYATEVRGPTSQSGNQRAIELAQRAPVSAPPRSTGIVPTASRAQRPVDPDLDEPLPRYVP